jgi:hypothetical protein
VPFPHCLLTGPGSGCVTALPRLSAGVVMSAIILVLMVSCHAGGSCGSWLAALAIGLRASCLCQRAPCVIMCPEALSQLLALQIPGVVCVGPGSYLRVPVTVIADDADSKLFWVFAGSVPKIA